MAILTGTFWQSRPRRNGFGGKDGEGGQKEEQEELEMAKEVRKKIEKEMDGERGKGAGVMVVGGVVVQEGGGEEVSTHLRRMLDRVQLVGLKFRGKQVSQ